MKNRREAPFSGSSIKTKTAMGARLLRSFIEQPLIDKTEIERRQQAIEELNMNYISRRRPGVPEFRL